MLKSLLILAAISSSPSAAEYPGIQTVPVPTYMQCSSLEEMDKFYAYNKAKVVYEYNIYKEGQLYRTRHFIGENGVMHIVQDVNGDQGHVACIIDVGNIHKGEKI